MPENPNDNIVAIVDRLIEKILLEEKSRYQEKYARAQNEYERAVIDGELFGEVYANILLPVLTGETINFTKPFVKEAMTRSSKFIKPLGAAIQNEFYVAASITHKYGSKIVRDGLGILREHPQIVQAEQLFYADIKQGVQYVNNIKQFAKDATTNAIECLEQSSLIKDIAEKYLPTAFIPDSSINIVPAHSINGISHYIDFKNNRWFQDAKGTWLVEVSQEMQEQLGWALESRKVLEATEFAEKITEAMQLINISAAPYSRIQQVPTLFQEYYNELLRDISKISEKIGLFEGTSLKPSLRDIEHIFDLQFRLDKVGQLKKIHGFHHDYLRAFERSGLIEVLEEKIGPGGCYWMEIKVNGITDKKTFFPAHWTREKVMKKIIEAINNPVKPIVANWDGTQQIIGMTSEGIEILIKKSATGTILTTHPIFSIN